MLVFEKSKQNLQLGIVLDLLIRGPIKRQLRAALYVLQVYRQTNQKY